MVADAKAPDRDWSPRQRAAWWIKFVATVAGAIVAFAGAASVLGLRFDVQSKTEARAEHAEIVRTQDEKLDKAIGKVEAAIDRLGTRIDTAIERRVRR